MHEQWLAVAEELATNCIDPYVKIGCVLVRDNMKISEGWNRTVRDVEDTEARHMGRPAMYWWVEHAERIAIFNAARSGISTKGATAYVNVSPHCVCSHCLRAFIECGVTCIVGTTRILYSRNAKNNGDVNQKMIEEAGIEIITINS